MLVKELKAKGTADMIEEPEYLDFRAGDIRHSLADTSKANSLFGYEPQVTVGEGVGRLVAWWLG